MRPALVACLFLGAALSSIVAERRDAFGSDDPVVTALGDHVHDGQCVAIDAVVANATGAPFDDSTLPSLDLYDPDIQAEVTERFIRCGQLSAILLGRRSEYGEDDAWVAKFEPIVHQEQLACLQLLTPPTT